MHLGSPAGSARGRERRARTEEENAPATAAPPRPPTERYEHTSTPLNIWAQLHLLLTIKSKWSWLFFQRRLCDRQIGRKCCLNTSLALIYRWRWRPRQKSGLLQSKRWSHFRRKRTRHCFQHETLILTRRIVELFCHTQEGK